MCEGQRCGETDWRVDPDTSVHCWVLGTVSSEDGRECSPLYPPGEEEGDRRGQEWERGRPGVELRRSGCKMPP